MDRHQLALHVRNTITDDELLDLVLNKPSAAPTVRPTAPRRDPVQRVTKPTNTDSLVLAAIAPGKGYAVSELEELVPDVPRTGIQRTLAKLKAGGAIQAAGERRYMRYGLTVEDAEAASKEARGA